jgi:hypothetical protein
MKNDIKILVQMDIKSGNWLGLTMTKTFDPSTYLLRGQKHQAE